MCAVILVIGYVVVIELPQAHETGKGVLSYEKSFNDTYNIHNKHDSSVKSLSSAKINDNINPISAADSTIPLTSPVLAPTTASPSTGPPVQVRQGIFRYSDSYAQLHFTQMEILDLLDWEQSALLGILNKPPFFTARDAILQAEATCQPPPGVAATCCPGSFSAGGGVSANLRRLCSTGFGQWEEMRASVNSFFHDNPILISDTQQQQQVITCDVCQIVELARANQLNITLIGDSMQSQVYEGLKCELSRRSYQVEETTLLYNEGETEDMYRKIGVRRELVIQSSEWANAAETTSSSSSSNGRVYIKLYMAYVAPIEKFSEERAQEVLANTQVLVLGWGLHWNILWDKFKARDTYGPAMTNFIKRAYYDATSKVQLVVHRETSAQHFDIPGGDYSMWAKDKANRQDICVKAIHDNTTYWREPALYQQAKQEGFNYIVAGTGGIHRDEIEFRKPVAPKRDILVLPWYKFTEPFYTSHQDKEPGSEGDPDCTHFCGSPFLYYPLWRSLRLAMDRQYA